MISLLVGRRLVIVHNPHSSRADEVKQAVFSRLDAAGYSYKTLEVHQASLADNVARLSPQIHAGDIVISAAGDGSAHALSQAVMDANQENVMVGFLAFGNFNDLPHTFTSHWCLKDPIAFLEQARQEVVYPLIIEANGRYVRQAMLYATLGWTARAAGLFDDPAVRRRLQIGSLNLAHTMLSLGLYYFKSRRTSYLPPFTYRRKLYTHRTDIICANGPSVARFFRTNTKYYKTQNFLQHVLNVSRLVPNIPFMVSSVLGRMPGSIVQDMRINFQQAENLPLQCDGEVIELHDVTQLRIKKSTIPFHILTNK